MVRFDKAPHSYDVERSVATTDAQSTADGDKKINSLIW